MAIAPLGGLEIALGMNPYDADTVYAKQLSERDMQRALEMSRLQQHIANQSSVSNMFANTAMPAHNPSYGISRWVLTEAGKEAWNKLGSKVADLLEAHERVVDRPNDIHLFDEFLRIMAELNPVLRNAGDEYRKLENTNAFGGTLR